MKSRALGLKLPPIHAQLIGSKTCSAAGRTAVGPTPVLALCRQLIAAEFDANRPLTVYRGATLVGEAAKLTVRESTRDGRPRFAPLSSDGSALMRKSRLAAGE